MQWVEFIDINSGHLENIKVLLEPEKLLKEVILIC